MGETYRLVKHTLPYLNVFNFDFKLCFGFLSLVAVLINNFFPSQTLVGLRISVEEGGPSFIPH